MAGDELKLPGSSEPKTTPFPGDTEPDENLQGVYGGYRESHQELDAMLNAMSRSRQSSAQLRPVDRDEAGNVLAPPRDRFDDDVDEYVQENFWSDNIWDDAVDLGLSGAFDFVGGLAETPNSIRRGVLDAGIDILDTAEDVTSFLARHVADFDPTIPGAETARQFLEGLKPEFEARTVTGQFIEDTAEFMTGFIPILGQLNRIKKFGSATGQFARLLKSSAAGGLALSIVTDPAEESLAEFVRKHPELEDPVNAYLDSDAADERVEERLKEGLIGFGLGAMTEGVFAGLKMLRASRVAKKRAQAQAGLDDATQDVVTEAEMRFGAEQARVVGTDERLAKEAATGEKTLFTKTAASRKQIDDAARAIEEKFPPGSLSKEAIRDMAEIEATTVEINLNRFDTADDVLKFLQDTTDIFKDQINRARRGKISNAATQLAADTIGLSLDDLLSRKPGTAWNAAQSLWARKVWTSAAEDAVRLANAASGPKATPLDMYRFRKGLAVYEAINEAVLGIRAEAGRALQQWNIIAKGDHERHKMIRALLDASGGDEVAEALASRLTQLAQHGASPAGINAMLRGSVGARTVAAAREAFVMGLLWSPSTHIVNTMSNSAVAIQQIVERKGAELITRGARGLGREALEGGVEQGEAMMMWSAMIGSIWDMMKISGQSMKARALRRTLPADIAQRASQVKNLNAATMHSKIDLPGRSGLPGGRAISSEAIFQDQSFRGKFGGGIMRPAVDYFGKINGAPGVLLGAEDSFFKTIGYSMELKAQAFREATRMGGNRTQILKNMEKILKDPPERIRIEAVDASVYNTFQNMPGNWGKALLNLREKTSDRIPFGTLLMPFIKTPTNILRHSMERSPAAFMVRQWRADFAAGGAKRDIAMARMAGGTAIMAAVADYAYAGNITGAGPKEPEQFQALLRQGWQPFSVIIGDRYYSYNRTDPFGLLAGVAATMAETFAEFDLDEAAINEFEDLQVAAVVGIGASLMEKTYLQGLSNFFLAASDPQRYGNIFVSRSAGSTIPFVTALGTISRAFDNTIADTNTIMQGIQARIPGIQGRLPRRRDIWGHLVKRQEIFGRLVETISPIRVTERVQSPIDKELIRIGMNLGRIPKSAFFQEVEVDFRHYPEVYEEYVRLSGHAIKHPVTDQGAEEFFNDLVTGNSFLSPVYELRQDGEPKENYLRRWITKYRAIAQREIMSNTDKYDSPQFQAFRDEIQRKQVTRREIDLPAL